MEEGKIVMGSRIQEERKKQEEQEKENDRRM